jgi:hypothetical protein
MRAGKYKKRLTQMLPTWTEGVLCTDQQTQRPVVYYRNYFEGDAGSAYVYCYIGNKEFKAGVRLPESGDILLLKSPASGETAARQIAEIAVNTKHRVARILFAGV